MRTLRGWLTNALMALAGLAAELRFMPRGRRNGLLAGAFALGIVALTATLLLTMGRPTPPQPRQAHLATATATHTAIPPTHTPRPKPTATSTVPPPPPVKEVQAPLPPPPPVPPSPPAQPTATPCPTPTPAPIGTPAPPTAVPTDTAVPTATTVPAASPSAAPAHSSVVTSATIGCTPCGQYAGNNPSQATIQAALDAAAQRYHLPNNLLYAIAWQESSWHEDVMSCDNGIGLMQVQTTTYPWLNDQAESQCGLTVTHYDPYLLQDNAYLGAKFIVWLSCFFEYWGNEGKVPTFCGNGTAVSDPAPYTSACYYQQAKLQYPDVKNADGSVNAASVCAAVFKDPAHPEYSALSSTANAPWNCPYNATATDATMLEVVLSSYNQGPDNFIKYGFQNWSYVNGVRTKIILAAQGQRP